MTLQALLVSKDDEAAEVLSRILAGLGMAVERFSDSEVALQRLREQRFDSLIVDFDEPETARQLLKALPQAKPGALITMALLRDPSAVRQILQDGAKFILHKPVAPEQAESTLRAATSLLRRERRRSYRVPVQAPVQLRVPGGDQIEGIPTDAIFLISKSVRSLTAIASICFSEISSNTSWPRPRRSSAIANPGNR